MEFLVPKEFLENLGKYHFFKGTVAGETRFSNFWGLFPLSQVLACFFSNQLSFLSTFLTAITLTNKFKVVLFHSHDWKKSERSLKFQAPSTKKTL